MSALDLPVREVFDPATGEAIGHVPAGSAGAALRAVGAARAAQVAWSRTAPGARAALLKAAARRLREQARELAELYTLESGRPPAASLGGVEAGVAALDAYAALGPLHRGRAGAGDLVLAEPVGVVAVLVPWRDSVASACAALAAALVTGNAVVLRPSERAPLAVERLVDLLDLGDVLRVSHGDARPLAAAADLVLAEPEPDAAAMAIDAGVEPEWAAALAADAFARTGLRVRVHAAVAEPFLAALAARARDLALADVGPLIDEDARAAVHRQVHDAVYSGAELRAGGEPLPGAGYFYPPTVLVDPPAGALVLTEPLCGPVVAVRVVECFGAALAETGRCAAASVLTPCAGPVWHSLDAATVSVNSLPPERPVADPGRLDELTRTKAVFL